MFQTWLLKIENQFSKFMKALHVDRKEEFISAKLKDFCNKKSIKIKYATLYIPKKNSIVEKE